MESHQALHKNPCNLEKTRDTPLSLLVVEFLRSSVSSFANGGKQRMHSVAAWFSVSLEMLCIVQSDIITTLLFLYHCPTPSCFSCLLQIHCRNHDRVKSENACSLTDAQKHLNLLGDGKKSNLNLNSYCSQTFFQTTKTSQLLLKQIYPSIRLVVLIMQHNPELDQMEKKSQQGPVSVLSH